MLERYSVLLCDHLACNAYKRCMSLISGFNHHAVKSTVTETHTQMTLFEISIYNNQIFSTPNY